jgi:cation diffusion facilitator family transporter
VNDRYASIARVLVRVLVLNFGVAVAKIAFGYFSGAVSVLSDGFHSLIDASSNVVGLIGISAASQPPDEDHPYGHRKYETVASSVFVGFTALVVLEVLRNAYNHFTGRGPQHVISISSFLVMVATIAINLFVIWYETREGRRLSSEMLMADALQTRADVWSSLTVIAALFGARLGFPLLDPLAALVVAAFISYGGYQIFHATTGILSDRSVMVERDIEHVVMSVPGVVGCHEIRTRGSEDHVFLDLHVWLPAEMRLDEAHHISHVVKD